jgi:hypothetical protein
MNNRFFYNWVPKQLDVWLLLSLSIMLSFNGGVPSTILGYVIGAQSAMSADLSMAGFAYLTGLACVLPLTLRLQQFSNNKHLLCFILPVLILLNYLFSVTDQPLILVMVSFIFGFLKMIATLLVVLSLIPILMPKGERYQLYCVYYPLSLVFGPLSGFMAAGIADHWNFQFSFHAQNLLLFTGLLIVILLVHSNKNNRRVPLYQYDWIGTLFYVISMLLASYVIAYGLTDNWFHSVKIIGAAIGAILFLVLFIRHSLIIRKPLINFGFFMYWKPLLGVVLLLIFCLFFNTAGLISPFLNIILRSNPVESAKVNTYVIPGYITGTLLCFLYYRKYTKFNVMAAVACASFLLSNWLMYRLTSSFTSADDLFFPMFFRAMATVITYISVGLYITTNIPYVFINDITVFVILIRSLVSPLLATTLYGNWLYNGTIRHMNYLADSMDRLNPYVVARSASIISSVRTQATLLAIRDVYGILIVTGITLLIFIIFFPFHGSEKRVVFNWRNPLFAKEVAQSIVS